VVTTTVDPSFTSNAAVIHHAGVFGYATPATCGKTAQPKPSASEWVHVTCAACLSLMVHARRANDNAVALCGAAPGVGRSTTRRCVVECPACISEIENRLSAWPR
jgi:hypothetical protein